MRSRAQHAMMLLAATSFAACGHAATRSHAVAATHARPPVTVGERATGSARPNDPAFRKRLTKFTACLQRHRASVPVAHTGFGPVLELDKINTNGARLKAPWTRCRDVVGGTLFHNPDLGKRSGARGAAAGGRVYPR